MGIAGYIRNDAVYRQVETALSRSGFACERFLSEAALLRSVRRRSFALILIDLGVDAHDGESIFTWLNCRSGDDTPVMALSMTRSADLIAMTLNAGADEFITLPFETVEFVARMNALLRRSKRSATRRSIELAGFAIDREANTFTYQGKPIELTPREFTMAWLFFSTPNVYISRERIGSAIWGTGSDIAGRTIEQHVYKLRRKLELGVERGVIIRTAYSHGYRLEVCKPAVVDGVLQSA